MKYLSIILLAFFLIGASLNDAREANEAYRDGDYDRAVELYKKAIQSDAENSKLYYNLANALAKKGETEEAVRYFEQFKSMTDDAELKAMADYNIGNIYSEMKEWGEATKYYKNSLRSQAADIDAKHNYELAKKKQENNEEGQDQNQDQNQQQQDQEQNQDQQQDDQQQNQQDQQQDPNQQQDQNQNQDQQNQQPAQKMDQAQAEKILEALAQKEKELLKQFKKQKSESSQNTNDKDW